MNVSFSATLQAAMQCAHLLDAQVQQAAFELDASLGEGAVTLYRQLAFESASLQVSTLSESADRADQELLADDALAFEMTVKPVADDALLSVKGQFHPTTDQAAMQFSFRSEPEFRGDLQWQWVAAQQAEAAYPQLELRLENPTASLASGFIAEHLAGQVVAEALQLQLMATLKDGELSLNESIGLQQVSASTGSSDPPHVMNDAPTLDVMWLQALLQNPQSDIELIIPDQQIALTEQLSLQTLIQAPVLAYLNRIAAQPFEGLALQMGKQNQNLAAVQFESGSAELTPASSESLRELAEVLLQRPGLGIELAGVYDPLIDNQALQTEQIRTHVGLATAAELAFQSGSEPPDFNDPTVHSVIDEFARRRLPPAVLSAFTRHFGEADVDRGVIPEGDIAAYYSALFELLVDHAEIPQGALITLARYRAQAVTDLLAKQGVSPDRLHAAGEPLSSVAELTGVPLHLQLVIHSEGSPELLEDSSSGGIDFEN